MDSKDFFVKNKKSLGQHWLRDDASLESIVKAAKVTSEDTVLEIGPGLGTLTAHLVKKARKVIAIEVDDVLAERLQSQIVTNNLIVINQDILQYDLNTFPPKYKVVANIPYYITGNIIRMFTETSNRPESLTLLTQKEVAERLAAKPGGMSILSVSAQLEFDVKLGVVIGSKLFTPAPKVDSQVVTLHKRDKPLFKDVDKKLYLRIVKAGFSARRKKLRSSISAGLDINKDQSDELLKKAGVNGDLRAQNLSLQDWYKLYKEFMKMLVV
jgi:16S rRNA (adenine1518-N6/adenine1519-N6)-dimethyltransferase